MTPFLLYLLLTFGAGYSHYKGWKGLAANYNTQSAPASFYTVT